MSSSRSDSWEYHVEQTDTPLSRDELNKLGLAGWELVAALPTAGHFIFKRPAPDLRKRVTREQTDAVKASTDPNPEESFP